MSESEDELGKTSTTEIPGYYGRRGEDYGLWRLRLRAACRVKGLWRICDPSQSETTLNETSSDVQSSTVRDANTTSVEKVVVIEQGVTIEKLVKASGLIISALGNAPLVIVAEVDGNPCRMLELLDARYPSKRTVSRIAVETQSYRTRYKNQNMSSYIDEYTASFGEVEFGMDALCQKVRLGRLCERW